MINRDYTKEVGLRARKETVPWPVALLILAVIAAGLGWFARVESKSAAHSPPEKSAAALVDRAPVS